MKIYIIMDNDIYDAFAYDEHVISEKLGLMDDTSLNANLKIALLQNELDQNKKQLDIIKKKSNKINTNKKEHFTTKDDNLISNDIFNLSSLITIDKKTLIFIVFILFIFCIVQYISHKNEISELMNIIQSIIKSSTIKSTT